MIVRNAPRSRVFRASTFWNKYVNIRNCTAWHCHPEAVPLVIRIWDVVAIDLCRDSRGRTIDVGTLPVTRKTGQQTILGTAVDINTVLRLSELYGVEREMTKGAYSRECVGVREGSDYDKCVFERI